MKSRKSELCYEFTLPYPMGLSVNHYWKRADATQVYVNPRAKSYKRDVYFLTRNLKSFGDLIVSVDLKIYPPNKRKMDIDNCLKVILDALQFAGVYNNDNQIKKLSIERFDIVKNGKLDIKIKSFQTEDV